MSKKGDYYSSLSSDDPAPSYSQGGGGGGEPIGYQAKPDGNINAPQNGYYTGTNYTNEPPGYSDSAIPDDFQYGTTVESCSKEVRMAFFRKVYAILTFQIAVTVGLVCLFYFVDEIKLWVQSNYWMLWVNLIPTFIVLFALIFKRRTYPLNFILLTVFTLLQGYTIGYIVSYVDLDIVVQAFLITLGVFIALTIFTLQTKFDYSGMGPPLVAGLFGLILLGFMQIFFHNEVLYIFYCALGVLIFCALIIYDTYKMKALFSPEDYIVAAVNLYMDIVNLFLFILSLLRICRN